MQTTEAEMAQMTMAEWIERELANAPEEPAEQFFETVERFARANERNVLPVKSARKAS